MIAASLTLTNGQVVRFGGDEADPAFVPYDISWDTSIPGGFGAASVTVSRPPNLHADDARLFSELRLYGPGNRTLYEGYVTGVPQVGAGEIQLQTSGWSTVLDRIQTFREIYVDRDLNRWTSAARGRRQVILDISRQPVDSAVEADTTNGLAIIRIPHEPNTVNPQGDAWYDAGPGCEVASVYYDMTSRSTSSHEGIWLSAANDTSPAESGSDLLTGTNSSSATTYTPTNPRRYAFFSFYFSGTAAAPQSYVDLRRVAVFGNHGLTKRGTAPDQGFYASDIIGDIVSRSPLSYTVGESIEPTGFVIPHLAFYDDTSLASAIEQVTALGGNNGEPHEWGCYDDKTFFWRSPGTYGRTWYVRRDKVATPSSEGPDADNRVAGVKVLYEDAAGITKSVGPPGSNSEHETSALLDSDPDNPAHRIPGAYSVETVGITTQQGAINIGTMILNERNRLKWRGSLEIQGTVEDAAGNDVPAYEVRAGDQVVISDDPDTTPRPVNSTSYEHGSQTLTASIGARPDTLEALLGRLAVVTDLIP